MSWTVSNGISLARAPTAAAAASMAGWTGSTPRMEASTATPTDPKSTVSAKVRRSAA